MKNFFLIIFLSFHVQAQQSAVVEYEYSYNRNIGNEAKKPVEIQVQTELDEAAEFAKKHKYILKFNPRESLYYVEKSLMPDDIKSRFSYKISTKLMGRGVYYQNAKKRYILNQKESMHQLYLVKDSLKNDWTISYEKKYISGYKCYKATKKCKCGKDIVAWFTPEIPLPFGPAGYGGTPGLILELTFFKHTLRLKKMKFPQKIFSISPPNKGKPITGAKLEDLQWQKRLELMQKRRLE